MKTPKPLEVGEYVFTWSERWNKGLGPGIVRECTGYRCKVTFEFPWFFEWRDANHMIFARTQDGTKELKRVDSPLHRLAMVGSSLEDDPIEPMRSRLEFGTRIILLPPKIVCAEEDGPRATVVEPGPKFDGDTTVGVILDGHNEIQRVQLRRVYVLTLAAAMSRAADKEGRLGHRATEIALQLGIQKP